MDFEISSRSISLRLGSKYQRTELLYLREFESIDHLNQELEQSIDYYKHQLIKATLKGMSPVQYRIHTLSAA